MSRGDSDSSENDSADDFEEPGPPVTCLFCDEESDTISNSISHVKSAHEFNIESYLAKSVTSTYDLIKIVTYVRRVRPTPAQLEAANRAWDSEEYLRPVDGTDPWLWTDFDFLAVSDDDDIEPKYVNSENGVITLSKEHFDQLQKKNQELQKQLDEKSQQMEKLYNILNEAEDSSDSKTRQRPGDAAYFDSYSCHEIHRDMLSDQPRMEAFKGLFDEVELFRGKSVLDVGCGTGILSMMAASAGATTVVGVEESDILYTAMEVIAENGMDTSVRLVKGKVETVELDGKFDVLVSEWMGYFLLFEGMLSSVIAARDRFLKPDGLVFPKTCSLYLVGISDPVARERRLRSEFYGYKMSGLRKSALRDPFVETVTAESVVTESALVYKVDVRTATQEDCFFSSDFTLVATQDTELTALCGYFDSTFEPARSYLTTSPSAAPTHWKQSVFYLDGTFPMRAGERLSGTISVGPGGEGSRNLAAVIALNGKRQTFSLE